MLKDIVLLLWLFLPVGLANTAPVIARKLPVIKRYNQPVDFGRTYRGKRIFGDHKTIRGIVAGVIMGVIVVAVQMILTALFDWPERISNEVNYSSPIVLLMGAFMGFGAVAGDTIKSFFKRQVGVAPGKSWVPFDQLDFVLGGLVLSFPFFTLPLETYILGLGLTLILHPTFNILAWLIGLQDKPY